MSLALNKPKLDNLADQIWKSAERLRSKFKAYEYQNVILASIVCRKSSAPSFTRGMPAR
jgi:type I restriction enzyme M protein